MKVRLACMLLNIYHMYQSPFRCKKGGMRNRQLNRADPKPKCHSVFSSWTKKGMNRTDGCHPQHLPPSSMDQDQVPRVEQNIAQQT